MKIVVRLLGRLINRLRARDLKHERIEPWLVDREGVVYKPSRPVEMRAKGEGQRIRAILPKGKYRAAHVSDSGWMKL